MVLNNVVCPISVKQINSHVSRTTVFFCVILMSIFMISLNPIWMLIVLFDYLIRAIGYDTFSPLRILAIAVLAPFNLKPKLTGKAPKMFAARLAVICAGGSVIFMLYGMQMASIIMGGLLLILAFMDAVFNLCVGCLIYNYIVYPFYKNKI